MPNIVSLLSENPTKYTAGSIFRDPQEGGIYILAKVSNTEWVAVSLSNGNRWMAPQGGNPANACEKLEFVSSDADINIIVKK